MEVGRTINNKEGQRRGRLGGPFSLRSFLPPSSLRGPGCRAVGGVHFQGQCWPAGLGAKRGAQRSTPGPCSRSHVPSFPRLGLLSVLLAGRTPPGGRSYREQPRCPCLLSSLPAFPALNSRRACQAPGCLWLNLYIQVCIWVTFGLLMGGHKGAVLEGPSDDIQSTPLVSQRRARDTCTVTL